MSAKQAIHDKLQGSVATYLWCGGAVYKQINKSLLLSLWIFFSKLVNTWQSYKQESDCLQHFLRLLAVYWPGVQSVWDNMIQQPMPHYLLAAMQPLSPCRPITGHRGRRHLATSLFRYRLLLLLLPHCLQCFDAVGWAAGRASGL